MTATLLYRIAAVVLVLFAAGHALGFLSFRPSSADGLAVYQAMTSVQFELDGAKYSYANFYTGFGLQITAYMLFSAFLAWHLGTVAKRQPEIIGALGWMFAAVQLACLVLSILYFFLVPIVFSAVVVICLVWAAWLIGRARTEARCARSHAKQT
jgi:hypothetical protein